MAEERGAPAGRDQRAAGIPIDHSVTGTLNVAVKQQAGLGTRLFFVTRESHQGLPLRLCVLSEDALQTAALPPRNAAQQAVFLSTALIKLHKTGGA